MRKIISFVVMLLLLNTVCFAQVKLIKKDSTEEVPSNKSLDEVVITMKNNLIKEAVEEAGVKLKDYELTKAEFDEFVKSIPKVEVKNKKVFMKKDDQQAVKMKLVIKIDPDTAKAYLEKVRQVREAKAQAQAAEEKSQVQPVVQAQPQVQEPQQVQQAEEPAENLGISVITPTPASTPTQTPAPIHITTDNRDTIQKALEESYAIKQEVAKFYENFENSLREDNEEIAKSYDGKISKINLNVKKDQWETTAQYNKKLEKNRAEKRKLEQAKKKAMSENKTRMAQLATSTTQTQIEKLKKFQSGKFYDENDTRAQVVSLGKVNADEKYFIVKVLYDQDNSIISTLVYDFSDMDIEQAKSIYQAPKQFIIEPLFSVGEGANGNVKKVLTAFSIRHSLAMKEKVVRVASAKVEKFAEIKKYETYDNILNKKKPVVKQEVKKVVKEPKKVAKEENED